MQTPNSRDRVKAGVKRRNPLESVIHHDGSVNGIAGGDSGYKVEQISGPISVGQRDSNDDGADGDEQVLHLSRQVRPAKGRISVQNFLENFGAGTRDHRPPLDLFQKTARRFSMAMLGTCKVHRNVCVDEDGHRRPAAVSASICSMSAVGPLRAANRITGSAMGNLPGARNGTRPNACSSAMRIHSSLEIRHASAALATNASSSAEIGTSTRWLMAASYRRHPENASR